MQRPPLLPQPEPTREPLPLYPGGDQPIIGWRIWRVTASQTFVPYLCSVARAAVWHPRQELHATCHAFTPMLLGDIGEPAPQHRAPWPDGGCQCGVWAFKAPGRPAQALYEYARTEQLSGEIGTLGWAIGTVKLWGRVVECEQGWRAEYAYPDAVELLDHLSVLRASLGMGGSPSAAWEYLQPRLAQLLANTYRIPVRVGNEPGFRELAIEHDARSFRWRTGNYRREILVGKCLFTLSTLMAVLMLTLAIFVAGNVYVVVLDLFCAAINAFVAVRNWRSLSWYRSQSR